MRKNTLLLLLSFILFPVVLQAKKSAQTSKKIYSVFHIKDTVQFKKSIDFEISKSIKKKEYYNLSYYYSVYLNFYRYTDYKKTVYYSSKALFYAEKSKNNQLINFRELQLLEINANANRVTALLKEAKKNKWNKNCAFAYWLLGNYANQFGKNDNAILNYSNALHFSTKENGSMKAIFHLEIAITYFKQNDCKKAKNHILTTIIIAKKFNDLNTLLRAYLTLANIYSLENDTQEQLNYYLLALDLTTILNQEVNLVYINYNIGEFFYHQKEYDSSINYLTKSIELNHSNDLVKNYALLFLAQNYIVKNRLSEAKIILDELETKKLKDNTTEMDLLDLLKAQCALEEKLTNWSNVIALKNKIIHLKDSIISENNKHTNELIDKIVKRNNLKFQLEKKEEEEFRLKLNLRHSNNISILIFTISVIFFVLLITIIRYRKIKKDKRESIEISDKIISKIEEERSLISMELHDGLGPKLTLIKMKIELFLLGKKIDLSEINLEVKSIIEDARNMCNRLFPSHLSEHGLKESMINLADSFEKTTALKINMSFQYEINQLSIQHQTHLYRIFQECITNTIRHSNAKTIHVAFIAKNATMVFNYSDDGFGFVNKKEVTSGIGLKSIKHRVEMMNGVLQMNIDQNGFLLEIGLLC